jgi:RNA polymerase sigma-70 factor (ECF subfamily)
MMGVMTDRLHGEKAMEAPSVAREFGSWMASEQRRIFLLCYRILQDRDEADMSAQDTFLKAHQTLIKENAVKVEDPAKWLTRIAVNTCLDRLRSRSWKMWTRRPKPEDESLILAGTPSVGPNAEDQVFAGEIKGRLAKALDNLSPRQRAVFTLRHFEDRKLDEIADFLGLDMGTVKAHMARALVKLREELRDLYHLGKGAHNG